MAARGELNAKQKRFVDEYLIDLNATQAAIRAGYSKKTADRIGAELLGKTWVKHAVELAQAKRAARTGITQDRILEELRRIAFSDKRRLINWGPNGVRLRDCDGLDDEDAAAVSEISESITQHGGSLKLKTYDKVRALELLGKHLGMFGDKSDEGEEAPAPTRVVVEVVDASTPRE